MEQINEEKDDIRIWLNQNKFATKHLDDFAYSFYYKPKYMTKNQRH
jgi:hypothetical protein